MAAYYNEFKPEAAHMLRQLIKDRRIASGDVDERSIVDVHPAELIGYDQCHFFAGIGGWSVALRLAGWGDARPVWTGSCPCQPFSTAGKQKGKEDERHLWPIWSRLITECRPAIVFGEQVAAAVAHGWWDAVADDLEREGYACGTAVLPACSVGKAHKRDRLWFVADASSGRCGESGEGQIQQPWRAETECASAMGDTQYDGSHGGSLTGSERPSIFDDTQGQDSTGQFTGTSQPLNVADANKPGPQGRELHPKRGSERVAGADSLEWLRCPDGKSRPVEPGIRLLAHGVQHRAPILHALGNAIVPEVAAEFIKAYIG